MQKLRSTRIEKRVGNFKVASFEEFLSRRHFPALDGLRAVAVLLVITWHVGSGVFAGIHGNNGVVLFFVLSGFLITTLALREEQRHGKFSYLPFMVRRAFRILPLFWLGIFAYAVMIFILNLDDRSDAYANALLWYLGYLPEVPVFRAGPVLDHGQGAVPFSGVWSLGIEEKFYLVWPAMAFVVLRKKANRGVLALALATGIWLFGAFGNETISKYIWNYAPIFLGCAVALIVHHNAGYRLFTALTRTGIVFIVFVALVALSLLDLGVWQAVIFQILVSIVLIAVVIRPHTAASRLLSTRPMRFVGAISYALYLFHSLALKVADMAIPASPGYGRGLVNLVLGMTIAVPACWLLHRYWELPLQNVGRSLATRLRARGAGESVAASAPRLCDVEPATN